MTMRRCLFTVARQSSIASSCVRRGYASAVSAAEYQFGQAVHETHPHLLAPGERKSSPLSTEPL